MGAFVGGFIGTIVGWFLIGFILSRFDGGER